jgi:hypothetical protein
MNMVTIYLFFWLQFKAPAQELDIFYFPLIGGPSNLALSMLAHTQSLRSLTCNMLRLNAVAAAGLN